ncbi:MAG: MMPL family transporter [Actinomycetota bacterium]
MSPTPTELGGRHRFFAALDANASRVIAAAVLITAILAVPFLTLAPTQSASTEPGGEVFDARDLVDERFVSSVFPTGFIIEDRSGNLATPEALTELQAATGRLQADPELGQTLFSYFEPDAGRDVFGVLTLADLVDDELRTSGIADGLADPTTDATAVSAAIDGLVDRLGEGSQLLGLSTQSVRGDDGLWTVPAISTAVLADDAVLGFGNVSIALGGDTEPEEYQRDLQEVLRTAEGFQVNGIAIDVNLTSQEQGAVAGPFIGFTILAVLVLVGLTFHSYWIMAIVASSFLALIVWLKGISNLIGLEDDLVLSLIVPVAMISFGVDFAFHAIGRYREERAEGRSAAPAFVAGSAAVIGALALALTSDSVAFLANLTSDIESIDQFGIGAAIALAAAFVLLGVVAPLVVSRLDAIVPPPTPGRRSTILRLLAGAAAASMAMASVLLMVFVLPWAGLILATVTVLTTLVVPALVRRRIGGGETADTSAAAAIADEPVELAEGRIGELIGRAVAAPTRRPALVLVGALAISAVAAVFAVRVPAEFDVEDFFSSDTDFVVGLDQIDAHVGDRAGEPALLYVEGDLTDPVALGAVQTRLDQVRQLDTASLARNDDGEVRVDGGVFEVFDAAWASPVMAGIVAEQTGVELTDSDGDTIPDTRAQVEALLITAGQIGVPLDAERLLLTPDDVNTAIDLDGVEGSSGAATVFELNLVNSRLQESVTAASDALQPIAEDLADDLGGTFVQVTGSPFVREASLAATNDALQVSLPVAVVLCLLVGTVFLRSIRYGVAGIVPILMVVSWLYAVMYAAGFAINLVTATIAAVSIGIGIDFAIHFIVRYREELDRHGVRATAIEITGAGTGLALVASAISSAVGFGILAFAPMPLFAAYGLLTMVMILMALVATLAVLPSLLVLITRDRAVVTQAADVAAAVGLGAEPAVAANGAGSDRALATDADSDQPASSALHS